MMNLASLAVAALHFHALKKDMDKIGPAIIRQACQMVADEAKRVLGTSGLQRAAVVTRNAGSQNDAGLLLESGNLSSSIKWSAEGLEGRVGSDSDKAVWMELGIKKIPPRTFLVGRHGDGVQNPRISACGR